MQETESNNRFARMLPPDWIFKEDVRFFAKTLCLLAKFANENSPDESTRVGALIVDTNGSIQSAAFNGWPNGMQASLFGTIREDKYNFLIHAESAAIATNARNGLATKGSTMLCTWAACPTCAHSIIQSGISRVVTSKLLIDKTPDRWKEAVAIGHDLLIAAGIELIQVPTPENTVLRFNGEWVTV